MTEKLVANCDIKINATGEIVKNVQRFERPSPGYMHGVPLARYQTIGGALQSWDGSEVEVYPNGYACRPIQSGTTNTPNQKYLFWIGGVLAVATFLYFAMKHKWF